MDLKQAIEEEHFKLYNKDTGRTKGGSYAVAVLQRMRLKYPELASKLTNINNQKQRLFPGGDLGTVVFFLSAASCLPAPINVVAYMAISAEGCLRL